MPKEILVVFHNGSKNEFEGHFECLGENTEKYKTLSIPIEKEIKTLIKMTMEIL